MHDRVAAPGDLGGAFGGLAPCARRPGRRGTVGRTSVPSRSPLSLVVVTNRYRHYLMLREADVPDVLVSREPDLAVDELAVLPEGDFSARTTVHHHGEEPTVAPMHSVIHHPRLVTRHYCGPVAMSGRTLMWSGGTVLPDSFRWHLARHLANPYLDEPVGEFVRLKRRHVPERSLEGDFYQLESAYPSHFGHVLTEVVSRMWGWDEAKRRMPGLKVLYHPRPDFDPKVERALFSAFGIADDDVVRVEGPVEVGSVASATPMWHNAEPHYVHPDLADVWERIGAGLSTHESAIETSPRIFISRSDADGQQRPDLPQRQGGRASLRRPGVHDPLPRAAPARGSGAALPRGARRRRLRRFGALQRHAHASARGPGGAQPQRLTSPATSTCSRPSRAASPTTSGRRRTSAPRTRCRWRRCGRTGSSTYAASATTWTGCWPSSDTRVADGRRYDARHAVPVPPSRDRPRGFGADARAAPRAPARRRRQPGRAERRRDRSRGGRGGLRGGRPGRGLSGVGPRADAPAPGRRAQPGRSRRCRATRRPPVPFHRALGNVVRRGASGDRRCLRPVRRAGARL